MSRQGRVRARTIENVKDFWNKEAEEWGDDPRVTIRDHYFRLLEIDAVMRRLKGSGRTIEVGCGSGFSSLFYGQVVDELVASDYAEEMVVKAQRLLEDREYYDNVMQRYSPDGPPTLRGNVTFSTGNILELDYPSASFDAAIAERVLINLPERQLQDAAVGEVTRVLKTGAKWILVEVTQQGHDRVDALRGLFGLAPIEKYWHNLYLQEPEFEKVIVDKGLVKREVHRFETFQFLTKVVHPLVTAPAEPEFLAGFNIAASLAARRFPDHQSVREIGLGRFLQANFRAVLAEHDPERLEDYDRVIERVVLVDPDFTACSHQVMYVLERS